MEDKQYKIWENGKLIDSPNPGAFGIDVPIGRFHRLDCQLLAETKPEDKVFVHTYEDAVEFGASDCPTCQPTADNTYYMCIPCGTFIPTFTKQHNLTCKCGKLTVDSIGCDQIQTSAELSDILFVGKKKEED